MSKNRLALVEESPQLSPRQKRQLELEEQWKPLENDSVEVERINRTCQLIKKCLDLKGKVVADLGCGSGEITRFLRDQGALVHAVDLSRIALKNLQQEQGIKNFPDFIPRTTLEDYSYDLVVCTDVIGDLPENDYRLLMNELSRLVKNDGLVVCSTPIDIDSDESLPLFNYLANTEFEILEWVVSHHRLRIKLPFFKKSRLWMRLTESITKNLYDETGISHAMFIGKRKPFFQQKKPEMT